MRTKIIIERNGKKLSYSSLRTCCNNNSGWKWGYLRQKKLPTDYKGWKVERVPYNEQNE